MGIEKIRNTVVSLSILLLCLCNFGQSAGASEAGDETRLVPELREATLKAVIVKNRPAKPEELQKLKIVRQGKVLVTQLNMALQVGDRIETDTDTKAFIVFERGVETYWDVGTSAEIASLRDLFGKIYVFITGKEEESDEGSRKIFKVSAQHVDVLPVRTKFQVQSSSDGQVIVTVEDGVVSLEPNNASWAPREAKQLQQATVNGTDEPFIEAITQEELRNTLEWVRKIQEIIPPEPSPAAPSAEPSPRAIRPSAVSTNQDTVRVPLQPTQSPVIPEQQIPLQPTPWGPPVVPIQTPQRPQPTLVPQLVGLPVMQAQQVLYNSRLRLGQQRESLSGNYRAGTVIWQSLYPGVVVAEWAQIDLAVEMGTRVPNLIETHLVDAQSLLQRSGLRTGQLTTIEKICRQEQTILQQYPPPGSLVRAGSFVNLGVSTHPKMCRIPNLVNMTLQEAKSTILNTQCFQIGKIENVDRQNRQIGSQVVTPSPREWVVIKQRPKAGREERAGTSIHLTLSRPDNW